MTNRKSPSIDPLLIETAAELISAEDGATVDDLLNTAIATYLVNQPALARRSVELKAELMRRATQPSEHFLSADELLADVKADIDRLDLPEHA